MIHDRARRNPLVALLAAVLLACALFAAGCTATLPTDPPGVTGAVTRIAPGDGRPSSFLVESTGTQPAGAISDKAQVNIPPTTMFYGPDGKAASLGSIAGIAVGTRVSVWFQGAVAESYPVQGSAKAVQILSE